MKHVILFLTLVALLIGTTARADIVHGRVVDSETKEPLPDASVKLTQYSDYGYSTETIKADSLGVFTFFAKSKGSIEASMLGYYSKRKNVLAFSDSRKDTINVGDIELKMSPQMLKMVQVKGRARRFTVKGDTIVFHPEAFHLQEGARLDELIRKLPGVEVDDNGKMSWNGKPIRITMDGESLMGGDDLVRQLPAEAVENIKAYNKQSEFSERTGKNDGSEDMVLDLSIKPGFLDRWYGDVKAGYQTEKYYEGELWMHRLSKTDPVMFFAGANNVDKSHSRSMNGGMSTWGNGFGQEQGASAGYQHNWQQKAGTHDLKSHYSFSGGVAHDDNRRTSGEVTENYFPNTTATRSTSQDYRRTHKLNPRLNVDLKWVHDSLNTFTLTAGAQHTKNRSHSRQTTEQEESTSFSVPYVATLSQHNTTHTDGHKTELNTKLGWDHYIKDGSLGASINLSYRDEKSDGQTIRTITAHNNNYTSSQLTQTYTSPSSRFSTTAEAHHARWLTEKWMIQAQYSLSYSRSREDRDFMTDGVTDATNSYKNLYSRNQHTLRMSHTINLQPVQLMPNISARWLRESQDYQRGVSSLSYGEGQGWGVDTTAVRHHFFIDPSLKATWKLSKTVGFELNYSFTTHQPDILQTIGYRDLTNPLFITEGNPNLRDSHAHDVKLTYNMVLARSQTSLSASVSYNHADRETTTALSYNPTTAVYVSRPENVRGSHSWNFRLNIDQALGNYFHLQNDFRLNTSQRHGYLTAIVTELPSLGEGQGVSSLNPRENLTLSLDYNWLKASAFAVVSANRLRYTATSQQNTTQWDNRYGLEAEATWGNFVFNTTLTERTSRGYTIGSMNRDILVWDGSVTWKILKNKARLTLEFNDILNNEDGLWSQQSAYQQVTSWQDFRHHYVGLSFTYHLDAKKKD